MVFTSMEQWSKCPQKLSGREALQCYFHMDIFLDSLFKWQYFYLIIIKLAVQYAKRQCKPQFTLNCFDQNESSVKRISLLLWFSGHFILMAIHKRRNNTPVYCSSCPHALLVSDSNEHAQFCVSPLISADFQLGPHILVQRLDQSELSPTKFGRIDSAAPPRDH